MGSAGEQEKVAPPVPTSDDAPQHTAPEPVEEKSVVQPATCEDTKQPAEDSKALVVAEKKPEEPPAEKCKEEESVGGTSNRDAALEKIETEKRLSLVIAWEDNEKTKAENKAIKELSSISSWEKTKKAALEAKLKKQEEALEKKKSECAEKMKNQMALLHKQAEEKRAQIEAKRREELLKVEELSAKFRITGLTPKKSFGCF